MIDVRGGGTMCIFTIQHLEKYFSSKNQKVESRFDYINCKAFGKTAEILKDHKEGDFILAEGKCQTGNYEREGVKTYTQDFEVLMVSFPAEAERNYHTKAEHSGAGTSYANESHGQENSQNADTFGKPAGHDSDLPF